MGDLCIKCGVEVESNSCPVLFSPFSFDFSESEASICRARTTSRRPSPRP